MSTFRFCILGAGKIAAKFCDAVSQIDNCNVCAVASKSEDRACQFADANGLDAWYDDYGRMLDEMKPDCAYIAVTPNDHYRLTMLCISKGIPVLCEKAMFQNSTEAFSAFSFAQERKVFVMEAMWSRFLPAVSAAREWIRKGYIGTPELCQCTIGFASENDPLNRYRNPALGGGAATDITVYAYELTTWLIEQKINDISVTVSRSPQGVDMTSCVVLKMDPAIAVLTTTLEVSVEEEMVISGPQGRIVIPHPHYASGCTLCDNSGSVVLEYEDDEHKNGFIYEIKEVINCILHNKTESKTVPHSTTLSCAELFDLISKA